MDSDEDTGDESGDWAGEPGADCEAARAGAGVTVTEIDPGRLSAKSSHQTPACLGGAGPGAEPARVMRGALLGKCTSLTVVSEETVLLTVFGMSVALSVLSAWLCVSLSVFLSLSLSSVICIMSGVVSEGLRVIIGAGVGGSVIALTHAPRNGPDNLLTLPRGPPTPVSVMLMRRSSVRRNSSNS